VENLRDLEWGIFLKRKRERQRGWLASNREKEGNLKIRLSWRK